MQKQEKANSVREGDEEVNVFLEPGANKVVSIHKNINFSNNNTSYYGLCSIIINFTYT